MAVSQKSTHHIGPRLKKSLELKRLMLVCCWGHVCVWRTIFSSVVRYCPGLMLSLSLLWFPLFCPPLFILSLHLSILFSLSTYPGHDLHCSPCKVWHFSSFEIALKIGLKGAWLTFSDKKWIMKLFLRGYHFTSNSLLTSCTFKLFSLQPYLKRHLFPL